MSPASAGTKTFLQVPASTQKRKHEFSLWLIQELQDFLQRSPVFPKSGKNDQEWKQWNTITRHNNVISNELFHCDRIMLYFCGYLYCVELCWYVCILPISKGTWILTENTIMLKKKKGFHFLPLKKSLYRLQD